MEESTLGARSYREWFYRRVGDGKSVVVYSDKWLPRPHTFKLVSPKLLPEDMRVAELIDRGGCWNEQLIRQKFLPVDAELILKSCFLML